MTDLFLPMTCRRSGLPSSRMLHNRRRLLLRTDRRDDIQEGFLALACCPICWRHLQTSVS